VVRTVETSPVVGSRRLTLVPAAIIRLPSVSKQIAATAWPVTTGCQLSPPSTVSQAPAWLPRAPWLLVVRLATRAATPPPAGEFGGGGQALPPSERQTPACSLRTYCFTTSPVRAKVRPAVDGAP